MAELDVAGELSAHTWVLGPLNVLAGGLALAFQKLVRPRLRPTDRDWRFRPGPLPEEIDEPEEQSAWRMRYDAVLSANTAEKVLLLGLVSCIFAQVLPAARARPPTLAAARRRWTFRSTALAFAVRLLLSVLVAYVANLVLRGRLDGNDTFFFLVVVSLITTLRDRWLPLREVLVGGVGGAGARLGR